MDREDEDIGGVGERQHGEKGRKDEDEVENGRF